MQNIRLANKLEDSTVTELQRLGAGPKTVVALRHLSEMTASLPGAAAAPVNTVPVLPPPPGPAEMKQILDEIRENARNYTKKLPDYVCTQVTKRHVDPTGTGSWHLEDQILEKLTFFEQKENYKVIMVNNSPATNDVSHEKLGGATSSGEFGSILYAIFAPETQTEFAWDRWTGLRKRWVYVFSFQTLQPIYSITHGGSKRTISTRARGSVYADRDTKTVVRIKLEADGIPADFPIQTVSLDLNYDFTDISGQEFLLPLRSDDAFAGGPVPMRGTKPATSRTTCSARTRRSFSTRRMFPMRSSKSSRPGQIPHQVKRRIKRPQQKQPRHAVVLRRSGHRRRR